MKNLFFKRIILLILFCTNFDSWSVQEDDADTNVQDTEELDVVDVLLLEGLSEDKTTWDYIRYGLKRGGCIALAVLITYWCAHIENNYVIK